MRETIIQPKTEGKGRSFRAFCLATVEADLFWEGGKTETEDVRPVWAMFANSHAELNAFQANLSCGRVALFAGQDTYGRKKKKGIEFLRSAGYRYTWQREEEPSVIEGDPPQQVSVMTVCLPEFFVLDPGMVEPSGVHFIVLPPADWVAKQQVDAEPLIAHALACKVPLNAEQLAPMVPLAYLFCAYLDRRIYAPLVADSRFYMQVFCSALEKGLATYSADPEEYRYSDRNTRPFGRHPKIKFIESNTADVGLLPGIAFRAEHALVETWLAEETTKFFSLVKDTAVSRVVEKTKPISPPALSTPLAFDGLGMNEKERQVTAFVKQNGAPVTIRMIASALFQNEPKRESWTRNSLRRPIRLGLLEQVERGTYAFKERA